MGVASSSSPEGYANVLEILRSFSSRVMTGDDSERFKKKNATDVAVTATACLLALLDGHLTNSSVTPAAKSVVVGEAGPATDPDVAQRAANATLCLELVDTFLGDLRFRIIIGLARLDPSFDWVKVSQTSRFH